MVSPKHELTGGHGKDWGPWKGFFRVPGKGREAALGLAAGGRFRGHWVKGFPSQTGVDDDTLKPGCPDRGSADPGFVSYYLHNRQHHYLA